jgi:hypothetical protein
MSIGKLSKCANKWDTAIAETMRHIEELEAALRVMQRNKAAGVPWPGEKAAFSATQN